MLQMEFAPTEVAALRSLSLNHPHPRVRVKATAVLMKSQDISHQTIQTVLDISGNTLRSYLRLYQIAGKSSLEKLSFYQPSGKLAGQTKTLDEYFEKNPARSIKQAMNSILQLTGIKIGETQTRKFLKTIGLRRRLVGSIPAKADPVAQQAFLEEKLEPLLAEARAGERTVYFVDAAHFVLSVFLGYLWCKVRVFVKSSPGRQRFNVLGAIDAVTHEMITVTNNAYINAQSVCELLHKIAAQAISGPITLVLDNARYQRCELVTDLAKKLEIELLFLPPYSPNLNLIERVWKFVKKECLSAKYYENFNDFSNAIESFVTNMDTRHNRELESLLSHRFQTFEQECRQVA